MVVTSFNKCRYLITENEKTKSYNRTVMHSSFQAVDQKYSDSLFYTISLSIKEFLLRMAL